MKKEWLQLMRPLHWTKNGLVILPLIFSGNLFTAPLNFKALVMVLSFSLAASGIYVVNDLVDREKDRIHPRKKNRPLASGRVGVVEAYGLFTFLFLVSISLAYTLGRGSLIVLLVYILLQVLYSLSWQNHVVMDVACIATGFVLRTVAGGLAIGVHISPWMLACAFLWAFFIAINKRKSETERLGQQAGLHRQVLDRYSPGMLYKLSRFSLWATNVAYLLYTLSGRHSFSLVATAPLVTLGMLRYQYLVDNKKIGGSPEMVLFQDAFLFIVVVVWVILSAIIVMVLG